MKNLKKKGIILLTLATIGLVGCGSTNKPASSQIQTTINGLSLDKESATIDAGRTIQLTATITPAAASETKILWESSDESVATVDDKGLVTGVNFGDAVIKAKTEDGKFHAECEISVSGYHLSQKVFNHFGKVENNNYNTENGYKNFVIDVSNEDYMGIKFKRNETNEWASIASYYETTFAGNEFEFEIELVKGNLPNVQIEFSGEQSFKFYERVPLKLGERSKLNLNITDLNYKMGEDGIGSWGSVFIEPNNPMDSSDTHRADTDEVELRLYRLAINEGVKKAPEQIKNLEFDSELGKLKFDKNYASTEYELEVYKVEGSTETKLELDVKSTRFTALENIPNMKYTFTPKKEENFGNIEGSYKARVRGKNSVGEGEWSEYAEFTVGAAVASTYESEGFAEDGKIGLNQWNNPAEEYVVEKQEAGYLLKFKGNDETTWNAYQLGFDKNGGFKKLHMEIEVLKGNITSLGYEFNDWAEAEPEASDGKQQGDLAITAGKNVLDVDITVDLSKGTGVFFLQPGKQGASIGECELLVTSMKLTA